MKRVTGKLPLTRVVVSGNEGMKKPAYIMTSHLTISSIFWRSSARPSFRSLWHTHMPLPQVWHSVAHVLQMGTCKHPIPFFGGKTRPSYSHPFGMTTPTPKKNSFWVDNFEILPLRLGEKLSVPYPLPTWETFWVHGNVSGGVCLQTNAGNITRRAEKNGRGPWWYGRV